MGGLVSLLDLGEAREVEAILHFIGTSRGAYINSTLHNCHARFFISHAGINQALLD
jgi:hypothetical protein